MSETSHSLHALPLPYAGLPYVDDVERFDETGDGPLFSKIADILLEARLEDTFGVSLLHVHFTLGAGEVVWESHDRRANTLSTGVCTQASVLSRGGLPTSCGFWTAAGCRLPSLVTGLARRTCRGLRPRWSASGDCWKRRGRRGGSAFVWHRAACAPGRYASMWSAPTRPGGARSWRPNGCRCATAGRISIHPGRSGLRCWREPALSATPASGAAPSARPHASSGASTVPGMMERRTNPVRDPGVKEADPGLRCRLGLARL